MAFTDLETRVMDMLLAGDHPALEVLRVQWKVAKLKNRELTGCGFYTAFEVPADAPRLQERLKPFGDVFGQFPELENEAGFLLFLKDGALDMLEGYCHDDAWEAIGVPEKLYYMAKTDDGQFVDTDTRQLKTLFQ